MSCRQTNFRSSLVTPADRLQCRKAIEVGADIAVTDLEDSIEPNAKSTARQLAMQSLLTPHPITRALRINSPQTEEGVRDLVALLDSGAQPEMLHIPKVNSAEDVLFVDRILGSKLPQTRYCAIIETASGLLNVLDISRCSRKLDALIFGAGDFSRDLNVALKWSTLLFARQQIALAAASAHLLAIDSPCFYLDNLEMLREESVAARDLGFAGKIAIHPDQISVIHGAFTPHSHLLETARSIVEQSKTTNDNIFVLNGRMIGPPIVEQAAHLIRMATQETTND